MSLVTACALALCFGVSPAHAAMADKPNDFDSNGRSDAVFIARLGQEYCLNTTTTLTGSGFWTQRQVGCGWDEYTTALSSVGDNNRDGIGDVVSVGPSADGFDRCLYRWNGDGNGYLRPKALIGCGWSAYAAGLAGAGDLNNDGNGDLVSVWGDCLYRWNGDGNGYFRPMALVGCGWTEYWQNVTGAGDLNRDGNADLVAIKGDCLFRWYGNGNGGFGTGVQVGCGWARYTSWNLGVAGSISGMGDINGDGIGDLVGKRDSQGMNQWLGDGNGGYRPAVRISDWDYDGLLAS